jgi:3-deoxy-D-manno-octulosonate 8-phosphate phosphatase (KDO 8-P phosphatase)
MSDSREKTLTESLQERCRRVELLLLDVDGVLTDGTIVYGDRGDEIKAFHVRDGSGLKFWTGAGKRAGILSGRKSPVVTRRAAELGLSIVVQGAADKMAALPDVLKEANVTAGQVCYVGDDVPDVPLLRDCGLGVAVADACPEVRAAADYITSTPGGRGAVREVIELLLSAQGLWQAVVKRYRA